LIEITSHTLTIEEVVAVAIHKTEVASLNEDVDLRILAVETI